MTGEIADTVQRVDIYPIKSCQAATRNGELIGSLVVGATGFESDGFADRDFVVVEPDTGLFVSQRGWNEDHKVVTSGDRKLAIVETDLRGDHLRVKAEGYGGFDLPSDRAEVKPPRDAIVHGTTLLGEDQGDEAAAFFTDLLGRYVRLIRHNPAYPRDVSTPQEGASNVKAGADSSPFLLTSLSSLLALHEAADVAPTEVKPSAFRPNIHLQGMGSNAFAEDRWRQIRVGDMEALVIKACERCPIPNINQKTGERLSPVTATKLLLPRMGWREGVDPATEKAKPFFGQHLNPLMASIGATVHTGDEVEVVTIGESNITLKKR